MKTQDQRLASSLVSGFDLEGWVAAEKRIFSPVSEPQPQGSVTVEQYAKMRSISASRAQAILGGLYKADEARRERWLDGTKGQRLVYWLNK